MIPFIEYLSEAIAVDAVNSTPGKDEDVVLQGRFQPPTAGHLKAIKAAYTKYHKPVVIVMIKGSKSDVFFDSKIQKKVFEKMLKGIPHKFLDIDNGFVGEWINALRNKGSEPIALFCGSDRVKTYSSQINRYKEKLNLNIKVEEIQRSGEDISASKVREALKNKDFELFKKNMDKSTWSLFDELGKFIK